MALRRVSASQSRSFNEMTGFIVPPGPHHLIPQVPNDHHGQAAFDENAFGASSENYMITHGPIASELAFQPWLVEASSASPLSRISSLNDSHYVYSQPPFMPATSMYQVVDQQMTSVPPYTARQESYISGQDLAWQQHVSGASTWHTGLPVWHGNNDENHHMPWFGNHVQTLPDSQVDTFPQASMELHTGPGNIISPRPSVTDSEKTSKDSDSDNSAHEDEGRSHRGTREGSCWSIGSADAHADGARILKLGRWSTTNEPFSRLPQRQYLCGQIEHVENTERLCEKTFQRPEHLRRHIRTVHGKKRNYVCKVPSCGRAFSRGDNLRGHYWTHLEHGGRAGKNEKLTLDELKAILGSKEKDLLRRLKLKFYDVQKKTNASQHQYRLRSNG
ncbi:hypothetical protein ACEQ8H_006388 [Pleosporales sp. CAS-2024a]